MSEQTTISFSRGAPSLDIVDVKGLQAAAQRAFSDDVARAVAYGTSVGHLGLREWIADRHHVQPGQVIVTNGSMQADAFLFDLLVKKGDAVVVERPTYDRTLLSLRNRGAQITAVGLESNGLDVSALEELLVGGLRPKLAHLIPNFHNPAGCTLALEKRQHLLALAEEYNFIIFEDDPYGQLRFEGEDIPSLYSLDTKDRVVYASSFSKTICPGIRVGYLVGPTEIIAQVTKLATETYISPNMTAQAIVNQFCRSESLPRSIKTVTTALRERASLLAKALHTHLPEWRFVTPQGGYFLWAEFPESLNVKELEAAAKEHNVLFVKGTDFMLEGGDHAARFAYSGVTPDQIDAGVQRIAAACQSL